MPNLWHNSLKDPNAGNEDPETGTTMISTANNWWIPRSMGGWLALPRQFLNVMSRHGRVYAGVDDGRETNRDDDCEYHHGKATNVQEVWFAGCHADVGGGSTPNDATHTLANPSLQWMISEVLEHAPEVIFRPDAFTYDKAFSTFTVTKTDRTPRLARPRIPSACHHVPPADGSSMLNGRIVEEEIVHAVKQTDPKQTLTLRCTIGWLNSLDDGSWDWRFRWNVRRPREIYDNTPNIHESVKLRENYEGKWFTQFIPEKGKQVKIRYVKSATRRPIDLR
ncbi:hypothetical protein FS837_012295 [Tulasnella sp. UAMH 9824]|nr:hypothetical protein FS837_012295 [Tulasnella sp. UAMH 9824]